MGLFSQVPGAQVTVWPCWGVPRIVGSEDRIGIKVVGRASGITGALNAGRLLPFELLATTVHVIN